MGENRITVEEYNTILKENKPHVLIDVRGEEMFKECHLENAMNIPKLKLEENVEKIKTALSEAAKKAGVNEVPLYLVCRSGLTSTNSIPILNNLGISCKDIAGGLLEWKAKIDPKFPIE